MSFITHLCQTLLTSNVKYIYKINVSEDKFLHANN